MSSTDSLTTFETKVRQLILRYQELRKENQNLYTLVERNAQDIKELQALLRQSEQNYNSLKMARMLEVTSGDLDKARGRVAKMIRDINKCIAIMSDEK